MIPGMEVSEVFITESRNTVVRPPSGGLDNPNWRYETSSNTDIRRRFERIRQQQAAARAFAEAQQKKAAL